MTENYRHGDMVTNRVRSGARLAKTLVAVLFLALGWTELREPDGLQPDTLFLLALMGPSFVGAVIAWWRERLGALMLKAGAGVIGVGWSYFSLLGTGEADLLASTLPIAAISLMAGLLFLASSSVGDASVVTRRHLSSTME